MRGKIKNLLSKLPFPELCDPVIILGCGRSGTTILGEALGHHSNVFYTNEPRALWQRVYPETDIWGSQQGQLNLDESDTDEFRNRQIRRLFKIMSIRHLSSTVVEKVPIRSFRTGFIDDIFPKAHYVHIFRNGLEVARSIESKHRKDGWFGRNGNNYKWQELVRYARTQGDPFDKLPKKCSTIYEKGLLEWRLSTRAAVDFLSGLPNHRYVEVPYRAFVDNSVEMTDYILSSIGLQLEEQVEKFVESNVNRRSPELSVRDASDVELEIGGNLLRKCLQNDKLS
ncbi:sulfotransferase family protein [Salinibacter ruber]|uniref:sulfotransferase family protein n=1 Tax=Salinibacter ruber TaxID=146919 RepID=UPI000E57B433